MRRFTERSAAANPQPPTTRLCNLVSLFPRVRVLVIGDFMLDQYIWGQVQRISPEAPVPVVRVTRESFRPGGAGNVVSNVRALGGRAAACGLVGRDAAGKRLLQELVVIDAGVEGIISTPSVITTCKTRIIAHSQQVVRLDREEVGVCDGRVQARLHNFVARSAGHFHAVVVSDYGKGVIDPGLLTLLAELRQSVPQSLSPSDSKTKRLKDPQTFFYLIDPKKGNFAHYRRASLIKPNKEEAGLAVGVEVDGQEGLEQAGQKLLKLWEAETVLVSRGEEGMTLFENSGRMRHFPTVAREVFDVTGAGDTVMAVCALALGAGGTFAEAAALANLAAGIVVGKVGTATVSPEELLGTLQVGR